MSILLAIANLVGAGMPLAPRPFGDGERRAAHLSVKETDQGRRGRQKNSGRPAGMRYWNAAVPMRSNLLRLEHELQTVVDGSIRAAAI
jgi:hypothetical protein